MHGETIKKIRCSSLKPARFYKHVQNVVSLVPVFIYFRRVWNKTTTIRPTFHV